MCVGKEPVALSETQDMNSIPHWSSKRAAQGSEGVLLLPTSPSPQSPTGHAGISEWAFKDTESLSQQHMPMGTAFSSYGMVWAPPSDL